MIKLVGSSLGLITYPNSSVVDSSYGTDTARFDSIAESRTFCLHSTRPRKDQPLRIQEEEEDQQSPKFD